MLNNSTTHKSRNIYLKLYTQLSLKTKFEDIQSVMEVNRFSWITIKYHCSKKFKFPKLKFFISLLTRLIKPHKIAWLNILDIFKIQTLFLQVSKILKTSS